MTAPIFEIIVILQLPALNGVFAMAESAVVSSRKAEKGLRKGGIG